MNREGRLGATSRLAVLGVWAVYGYDLRLRSY